MASSTLLRRLVAGLGTAAVLGVSLPTAGTLPLGGPARAAVSAAGAAMLYASVALAAAIHRSFPEKHDTPEDTGVLFTEGPYGLCRHPFYFFTMLAQLSIPLIYASLAGLAVAAALIPAWRLLIAVEERELLEYWGEKYLEYMEKVPALIPDIGKVLVRSRRRAHRD